MTLREARLLADDLTGALDAAAALLPAFPGLTAGPDQDADARDAGTRESGATSAYERLRRLAPHLAPAPGRLSFLKVDSLLRGHAATEIAAIVDTIRFDRVLIAPAMPFQRRVTRGGWQHVATPDGWTMTGEDVAAGLRGHGLTVQVRPASAIPAEGIAIIDAETDEDLVNCARAGLEMPATTLWVGAAGLAGALASALGGQAAASAPLQGPVLGFVGSDASAMQQQLARVPRHHLIASSPNDAAAVQAHLARDGAVFVTCDLARDTPRELAADRIMQIFDGISRCLLRPGLLFASGGETLRGLLRPLGAQALQVIGALEPGAPVSSLVGGRWDGVQVLSKSGAFGTPDVLERVLAATSTGYRALAS